MTLKCGQAITRAGISCSDGLSPAGEVGTNVGHGPFLIPGNRQSPSRILGEGAMGGEGGEDPRKPLTW